MAEPELGTKRLCASCGAKFYDLNKDPIHCPKCGAVYEVVVATRPTRPEPVAPVAPAAAKKPASTEPAEAEEEEVEMDESLDDDDTFIEEQEEEDADVTDIIGGDIENEEEG